MSRTNIFGNHAAHGKASRDGVHRAARRKATRSGFTLSEQDARPMTGIINGALLGLGFHIAVLTVILGTLG